MRSSDVLVLGMVATIATTFACGLAVESGCSPNDLKCIAKGTGGKISISSLLQGASHPLKRWGLMSDEGSPDEFENKDALLNGDDKEGMDLSRGDFIDTTPKVKFVAKPKPKPKSKSKPKPKSKAAPVSKPKPKSKAAPLAKPKPKMKPVPDLTTPLNVVFFGDKHSGASKSLAQLLFLYGSIDLKWADERFHEAVQTGKGIRNAHEAVMYKHFDIARSATRVVILKTRYREIHIAHGLVGMKYFNFGAKLIPDVAMVFAAVNRKDVSAQTSRTGYYQGLSNSIAGAQQQILFAHHFGIPNLVVVVSHMENAEPPFSKQMFDEFKKKIVDWMREKVPRFSDAIFLPIADSDERNMEAQVICSNPHRRLDHDLDCSNRGVRSRFDNMYDKTEKMPWDRNGYTFMQVLEAIPRVPKGLDKKPLRLVLEDSYRIQGVGTVPVGSVLYGTLNRGMSVKFCPTGITVPVMSISKGHHDLIEEAVPFDEVGFNVKGVASTDLKRGYTASEPSSYHGQALSFTAVVTINAAVGRIPDSFLYRMILVELGTQRILCQFSELIAKVDSTTGERSPGTSDALKYGESALVKFIPWEPMCVETFSEFPALGRFTMLEELGHRTYGMGFGIVESVEFADTFMPVSPYRSKKKKSGATLLALGSRNATRSSHADSRMR